MPSYWRIAAESAVGGICTALGYASSLGGFNPETLTLPAVAEIAVVSGLIFGIAVPPVVYFMLGTISFTGRILVCAAAIIATVALTLEAPSLGLIASFGLLIRFSFIAVMFHKRHATAPTLNDSDHDA